MPRIVRRFGDDSKGTTAVEFSLIAFPFIALMWAIIEMAMCYFAQDYLEEAVATSARLIRTGQAQQQGMNAQSFKDLVCQHLAALFKCQAGVVINIQTASTFGTVNTSATPAHNDDGTLQAGNTTVLNGGSGGSIVIVRAYYQWPVFVNRLGYTLATEPNGTHLLTATAVFKNEPFPW